jgi:hypothetical protein
LQPLLSVLPFRSLQALYKCGLFPTRRRATEVIDSALHPEWIIGVCGLLDARLNGIGPCR